MRPPILRCCVVNQPSVSSIRPRMMARYVAIALLICVLAVLSYVPIGEVWLLLLVPSYLFFMIIFAFGLAQLIQSSRSGRWLALAWGLSVLTVLGVSWVSYRGIMSDQSNPSTSLGRITQLSGTALRILRVVLSTGIGLALWGWVIHVRARIGHWRRSRATPL